MEKKNEVFGLINGYSFTFDYEGHVIKAWFSAFSGAEEVYVDGKLVASQRNLKRNSQNSFPINGVPLSTSLNAVSLLKGPYSCTLYRDGVAIKKQNLIFPISNKSALSNTLRLLFYIILGGTFGLAQGHYNWPSWSIILFIGLFLAFTHVKRKKYRPIIEEESCV